jgi:hypothetical protein
MKHYHKYVGLDVHKERNEVAIAESGGEVRLYGSISNDLHALEKLVAKLRGENVVLHFVYEAGPCGFGIYRRLKQLELDCLVVSPSLVPKKSGDRVNSPRGRLSYSGKPIGATRSCWRGCIGPANSRPCTCRTNATRPCAI